MFEIATGIDGEFMDGYMDGGDLDSPIRGGFHLPLKVS